MKTWVKVLIGVLVIGFVVFAGVVGGAIYWWKAHSGEYLEAAKAAVEAGAKYGSSVDEQACLDEALSRDRQDPSLTGSIKTGVFLQSCLKTSRQTPGFCSTVPEETEFINSAKWRVAQCQKAGLNDNYCQNIVGQVQKYCHSPNSAQ